MYKLRNNPFYSLMLKSAGMTYTRLLISELEVLLMDDFKLKYIYEI